MPPSLLPLSVTLPLSFPPSLACTQAAAGLAPIKYWEEEELRDLFSLCGFQEIEVYTNFMFVMVSGRKSVGEG